MVPCPYGATVHHFGACVMAAAEAWHDGMGIPVHKVPAVLPALTGVRRTQRALPQDVPRGPSTSRTRRCGRWSPRRRWCIPMTTVGAWGESPPLAGGHHISRCRAFQGTPTLRYPGELTRELISRRLLLGELHREDIARFLEVTTGIAPPQIILEAADRQTEGNLLFMLGILGEESRWG